MVFYAYAKNVRILDDLEHIHLDILTPFTEPRRLVMAIHDHRAVIQGAR
jgi:hypothetical protein